MKLTFHFRNTRHRPFKLGFMRRPPVLSRVGERGDKVVCDFEDFATTEKMNRRIQELRDNGVEIWIETDLPIQDTAAEAQPQLLIAKDSVLDQGDPRPSRFVDNAKAGDPITDFDPTADTLGTIENKSPKTIDTSERIRPEPLRVVPAGQKAQEAPPKSVDSLVDTLRDAAGGQPPAVSLTEEQRAELSTPAHTAEAAPQAAPPAEPGKSMESIVGVLSEVFGPPLSDEAARAILSKTGETRDPPTDPRALIKLETVGLEKQAEPSDAPPGPATLGIDLGFGPIDPGPPQVLPAGPDLLGDSGQAFVA